MLMPSWKGVALAIDIDIERTHSGNFFSFVGAKLPVPASRIRKIIEAPGSGEYGFSLYHVVCSPSCGGCYRSPPQHLRVVIFHSSQSGLISFHNAMSTMVYRVPSRREHGPAGQHYLALRICGFPVRVSILTLVVILLTRTRRSQDLKCRY